MKEVESLSVNPISIFLQVKIDGKVIKTKIFHNFPIVFGRSDQCDLPFPQFKFLSRAHGSISIQNGNIVVSDLGSTNGIKIDGQKILERNIGEKGKFFAGELEIYAILQDERKKTEVEKSNKVEIIEILKKEKILPETQKNQVNAQVAHSELKYVEEIKEVNINWDPEVQGLQLSEMSLQSIIMWDDEIYDVRNFNPGENIVIGPNFEDAVWMPILNQPIQLGRFKHDGALLNINKKVAFDLKRFDKIYTIPQALGEKIIIDIGSRYQVNFMPTDVFAIELGYGLKLYLKFVALPRPLIKREWIENKEEFRKAISASGLVHFIIAAIALMAVPKSEAPKIENVPPRFAKLIVEQPKQILAPPPPIVEPPPPPPIEEVKPPEPPKIVMDSEVVRPKPKPKPKEKPKKLVEQKKEVKKVEKQEEFEIPTEWSEPKQKSIPKDVVNDQRNAPPPKKGSESATAPAPRVDPAQVAAERAKAAQAAEEARNQQEMANIFSSLPGAGGGGKTLPGNIKVAKGGTQVAGSGGGALGAGGMISKIGSKGNPSSLTAGVSSGSDLGEVAGKAGYAKSGLSGKAGKGKVEAAVLGTPSFKATGKQGLTNEQVMKVVNQRIGDIHRCYERALFDDGNLVGRVEYEWEISTSGQVTSVSVKRSDMGNADSLNNCVMGVFRTMKFPKSTNGETTTANVGFPFGKN